MKLQFHVGERIQTAIRKAIERVEAGEPSVSFDFNGIEVNVAAGMSVDDVYSMYTKLSNERHEAYISTPEYKERQRVLAEEERRIENIRDVERARILKTAPEKMSLKDAEGWKTCKSVNDDPYGKATVDYAETWARYMESAMLQGSSLENCAKEMSHLADTDGITGAMYGIAVSILAEVWLHGETLRLWHNRATQIGNEGDKANATGGVLNPAIISFSIP